MIHNDHLATPQKMTDSTGTVVWAADYKPFGEATATVSTITNNLRFPGQYFDAETGLNYNYYRDYNPFLGRYIQTDPIGLKGGLNPYRYVQNPITFVDPLGLFGWSDFVYQYFKGGGAGIDLGSIGLLGAFQNTSSVKSAVRSFNTPVILAAQANASSLCSTCDKSVKTTQFTVKENTVTDVTWDSSDLFAIGHSTFFRSAQCSLSANCASKKYSYYCSLSFEIKDKFADLLDVSVELPGGTVYAITASWSQGFTGSGSW